MPIIDGQIINMETFPGKEGKAPRKVIQVLETLGKMAVLVNVSDMSQGDHGFKQGQKVQIPVNDGGYVDKFTGAVQITYTFFGFKNGNGNGKAASQGESARPASNLI